MNILSLITSDILAFNLDGLGEGIVKLSIAVFIILLLMYGVTAFFTIRRIQNRKSIDVDRAELQESIAKSSNKNKVSWGKVMGKVILHFGIGFLIVWITPIIVGLVLLWVFLDSIQ